MSAGSRIGARIAALAENAPDDPAANGRILDGLISLLSDDPADVPFLVQLAADFAWLSHPGRFEDARLEAAVARHATRLMAPSRGRSRRPGWPHVLHVLTQALPIGGHTRLAWRWMIGDRNRSHSVALTAQGGTHVPRELTDAAGGRIEVLPGAERPFLARAARLRELAAASDLVVLHVQPWDAVATTALAEWPQRPPVLFVNHADHVFWSGGSVADIVVCLRESGANLATRRRGVRAGRLAIVPIPVPPQPRSPDDERAGLRAALGVPREAVLAVSAGAPYKYTPMEGLDFGREASALIAEAPELHILVAGPVASDRWMRLEAESHGRIRALGPRHDLDVLLAGADLYLDAFPFASLTAVLEAARTGVPVVAPALHPPEAAVLASDSPGLDKVLVRPTTTAAYRAAVGLLVGDAPARRAAGQAAADAVRDWNSGERWRAALEEAYAMADRVRSTRGSSDGVATGPPSALDDRLVALHVGSRGLGRPLRAHLALASPAARVGLAIGLARRGLRLPLRAYVPARLRPALWALTRRR